MTGSTPSGAAAALAASAFAVASANAALASASAALADANEAFADATAKADAVKAAATPDGVDPVTGEVLQA